MSNRFIVSRHHFVFISFPRDQHPEGVKVKCFSKLNKEQQNQISIFCFLFATTFLPLFQFFVFILLDILDLNFLSYYFLFPDVFICFNTVSFTFLNKLVGSISCYLSHSDHVYVHVRE